MAIPTATVRGLLVGAAALSLAWSGSLAANAGVSRSADGPQRPSTTRQIQVPDSSVLLSLWDEQDQDGVTRPHYSISLDGETFSRPRSTSYELELKYDRFDPLAAAAAPDGGDGVDPLLAAGDDTNLYIVQFVTQPLEEFRAAIRDLGGTVSWYLPNHAHIVKMDPGVRAAVEALPYVRWVGPYHPAYRLEPYLVDNAAHADQAYPLGRYNVMVREAGPGQKAIVARRIEALGGTVNWPNTGKFLLVATLTPEQLFEVARLDTVLWIDRWSPLEADMDKAREISGANYIELLGGFAGADVRGEVIDLGFNLAHVDFQSRPFILHGPVGEDPHGSATSGIVFGDGTGDPIARGMLPLGQGIVISTAVMEPPDRYTDLSEIVQDPYDCVFQSASVGSTRTIDYTSISADIDAALIDFDVILCQSQSNAGSTDSRPQAWAKNAVSVGGVMHFDTLTKADDHWGSGASIGPAEDGRVKPDLTHFFDWTYTTALGSPTAYANFGGTSGATPIVAGHFGLLFEMWDSGQVFGNDVDPEGSVFDNRCHAMTAKALMINTASQYDWTVPGPNDDLDRAKQGWGMPDLENMYDLRFKMLIVNETDPITNLATNVYAVAVAPGEPAMKATLVYADPPGNPAATLNRVNDLTLRVTSPSSVMYWGNRGLKGEFGDLWSLPGGLEDTADTVENVFVENPEPGQWVVEVIASEIVEDSHVETPAILDADYALVVSGVEEVLPALFVTVAPGVPEYLSPGVTLGVNVSITAGEEQIVPGSETLHYRLDPNDSYSTVPLTALGGGSYTAVIPAASCGDAPQFYVSAQGDGGTVVTDPASAPGVVLGYQIGFPAIAYREDFQDITGWIVENDPSVTGGAWEAGVPAGDGTRGDPISDYDGSGACALTENAPGNSDVDGGPTSLISQAYNLTDLTNPVLTYAYWFTNDDEDADSLLIEITDDNGGTWVPLEEIHQQLPEAWRVSTFTVSDYISLTNQVRLRFSATDNPNDSITEAGIDAVEFHHVSCTNPEVPGDVDGDFDVDFADLLALLGLWGACPAPPADCPADFDGDGTVAFADLLTLLGNWGG